MKVRIEMVVEVDVDGWALTYGVESDAATIRKDVQEWAKSTLLGAQDEGLIALP
jgi:hypothetical protein